MAFEINEYLEQSDEDNKTNVIERFYNLSNIVFPYLYLSIYALYSVEETHVHEYMVFYNQLEQIGIEPCLLILDELIEKEYLGDDWQDLFSEITNKRAQEVLYNPETIKYDINSESQQAYEKILSGCVEIVLKQHDRILNFFNLS